MDCVMLVEVACLLIASIEAAPGSVEEFLASALPFAAGGYPVEMVVLAVREADSRLATALRYARAPTGR
ncbi:hypothetical protein [Streptomyces sp. NPDC093514]|uniref:hypothetical protein n=1 Tax=Streptomyces sp. NPDC093514 TaxID=3366039 RepID=UPI0037FCE633